MRNQRAFIFLLFATLFLVSCTTPDLSYDKSPNTVLIYARVRLAGAPLPQSECNLIPTLRVWGDGRVVMPVYSSTGERQIKVGHINKEALENGLRYLWDAGFFSDRAPEPANPSGAGFEFKVNLSTGPYSHGSNMPNMPEMYKELLRRINPSDLMPFVPVQARLMIITPKWRATGSSELWPAQFDFSLADVTPEGRMITGEPLAFIWRVLNAHEIPIVKSGNNDYLVGLEIPEIGMPWFKCSP